MSLKLKTLGLSLLAVTALAAIAAMNAAAEEPGHFTSDVHHTTIIGTEGGEHNLHLTNHGLSGEVGCTEDSYHGTMTGTTAESITITASYGGCTTTGTSTQVPVDMNGCTYTFTITTPLTLKSTVHVLCPTGKKIEVTHPNCTVSVHPQTVGSGTQGVTYKTIMLNEKHAITLDVTAQFNTTRHGLCQFIAPTNGTGTLVGSATVEGFSGPNQVNITAT